MIATKIESIKRCVRCVLPENLPSVQLDEKGECNHCKTFDGVMKEWNETKSQKKEELENIVNQIKLENHDYDCMVTLSGGKDSTYALYLMAKVYKLKCLCVTFDNGYLSDFAKKNIKNAIESANADHIFFRVNRGSLLKSYKLALERSGQFCSVCLRGITECSTFPQKAFDIPLLVSGDGKRISYLNMFPEVFEGGNSYFFTEMVKGDPVEMEVKSLLHPDKSIWDRGSDKVKSELNKLLNKPANGILSIQLYDHVEFLPEKILNIITEEMGWTKPEGDFEHIDCLLHEMQHFVNIFKFKEITAHTFYRSYQIRIGILSRDKALSLEIEDLESPKEPEVLASFLEQIGMSRENFMSSVKDWKNIDMHRPDSRRMTKNED